MPVIKLISWLGVLFLFNRVHCQNEFYVCCQDSSLYLADISTCNVKFLGKTTDDLYDIAVHPTSGKLYGTLSAGYLCIVDTQTCTLDTLGYCGGYMAALTFSADGYHLYGMRWGTDHLLELNYSNGNAVSVGSTGTDLPPNGDLTFYNGYLYYSGRDLGATPNLLMQIDPQNVGGTSILGTIPGNAYGLATLGCESHIYMSSGSNIRKLDLNSLTSTPACSVPNIINGMAQVLPSVVDGSFSLGGDTTVCETDSLLLDPGLNTGSVLWNNGSSDPIHVVYQNGVYWVEAVTAQCTYRDTISVFFGENPQIPFVAKDTAVCKGLPVVLSAGNPGAVYQWQDGTADSVLTADTSGIYWVRIENNGCYVIDSIVVTEINCITNLSVPNVFTPNNDGLNDVFTLFGTENIYALHTSIANRWGQVVHTSSNPSVLWDGLMPGGEPAVDGTYYYTIQYILSDGSNGSLNGFFHLIRH